MFYTPINKMQDLLRGFPINGLRSGIASRYIDDGFEHSLHQKWIELRKTSQSSIDSKHHYRQIQDSSVFRETWRPTNEWQWIQLAWNFSNFSPCAALHNPSRVRLQTLIPPPHFALIFDTLTNHYRRQRRRLESLSSDRLGHAHFLHDNAPPYLSVPVHHLLLIRHMPHFPFQTQRYRSAHKSTFFPHLVWKSNESGSNITDTEGRQRETLPWVRDEGKYNNGPEICHRRGAGERRRWMQMIL